MPLGSRLRRSLAIARTAGLALALSILSSAAHAGPTVWSRARDPRVSVQDEMVRDAQKAVMRYRRMLRLGGPNAAPTAALVLRDVRLQLAKVVASGATDFGVRLLYVEVLRDSNDDAEAFKALTKLLADNPPASIRSDALGELAILHAKAGRREEEIRAYTESLKIEPHPHLRARLLSNRAEALMATGDVTAAIDGYREALAPLSSIELFWYAPTTLFGLGVALDRSGNLEAGIDSIRLARAYDPIDKGLRSGSWFFSPAHDSHWYWALGAWSAARSATVWPARSESFDRSVFEWEQYIQDAPEDDRWIPLAKVRLEAVKRERDRMRKAYEEQARKALRDPAPASSPPWQTIR